MKSFKKVIYFSSWTVLLQMFSDDEIIFYISLQSLWLFQRKTLIKREKSLLRLVKILSFVEFLAKEIFLHMNKYYRYSFGAELKLININSVPGKHSQMLFKVSTKNWKKLDSPWLAFFSVSDCNRKLCSCESVAAYNTHNRSAELCNVEMQMGGTRLMKDWFDRCRCQLFCALRTSAVNVIYIHLCSWWKDETGDKGHKHDEAFFGRGKKSFDFSKLLRLLGALIWNLVFDLSVSFCCVRDDSYENKKPLKNRVSRVKL